MSESTCAIATYSSRQSEEHHQPSSPHLSESSTVPLYELQNVIQQYQAHPELLKLILTSKVEEDKRRAEEAKLRTKELDYYLKYDSPPPPPPPTSSSPEPAQALLLPPIQQQEPSKQQRKMSIPSRIMIQSKDRNAPYTKPTTNQQQRPDSPLSPSRKNSFDDHQQRRHSAATAMLAMGRSVSPCALPTSPSSPDQAHYPPSDEEMDVSR
jgi:hypothetical protein